MTRYIFVFFFAVIASALEISSFIPSLHPFHLAFLPIIGLVSIIFIFKIEYALLWSLVTGFILEIYTVLPFLVITMFLFVLTLMFNWIYEKFFPNRSFFSFLIFGTVTTILYGVAFSGIKLIYHLFAPQYMPLEEIRRSLLELPGQLAMHIILFAMIFLIFNALSRAFKSYFVFTR